MIIISIVVARENKGKQYMIKYKINVLESLKNKGLSTYKLRKEKLLAETTIQKLRDNKLVSWDQINKICTLLNCDVGDIVEYVCEK